MINFLDLSNDSETCHEIIEDYYKVLHSGKYILGDFTTDFEKKICSFLNTKYCVGVNSGFDALRLALLACDIKKNDEVITVANTFVATVSAIVEVGAIPVLVDVDDTRNIAIDEIEKHITPKTKAILPVHLSGIPCKMDEICSIAQRNNLLVIEDAAQGFGAKYNDIYTGTFGICGCFSLHPTKILGGCGDGGMIVTNNYEINQRLRLLRNHGLVNRDTCLEFGQNSRLDEIQSCFLLKRLETINYEIETRRKYAKIYNNSLKSIRQISIPEIPEKCYETYFTYTVLVEERDRLKEYLYKHGVDTRIHYPIPINHQNAYISMFEEFNLQNTDYQAEHILSLPCNGNLAINDIEYIINCIKEFFK